MPNVVLFSVYEAKHKANRPSLGVLWRRPKRQRLASEPINDVGFDPVDAGPLQIAWCMEAVANAYRTVAYEGEKRPELDYHFEWFGK